MTCAGVCRLCGSGGAALDMRIMTPYIKLTREWAVGRCVGFPAATTACRELGIQPMRELLGHPGASHMANPLQTTAM